MESKMQILLEKKEEYIVSEEYRSMSISQGTYASNQRKNLLHNYVDARTNNF